MNTKLNSSASSQQTPSSSKKFHDTYVRKLMLDTWSKSIFSEIKNRLQNSAMKIVYSERVGEPFDSQLVIGVRESYGKRNKFLIWKMNYKETLLNDFKFQVNLCSDPENRLKIYKEHFEKAYLDSLTEFYNIHAQQFITENGVINYLTYADSKLKEEEKRALKYLESCMGSFSIELVRKKTILKILKIADQRFKPKLINFLEPFVKKMKISNSNRKMLLK